MTGIEQNSDKARTYQTVGWMFLLVWFVEIMGGFFYNVSSVHLLKTFSVVGVLYCLTNVELAILLIQFLNKIVNKGQHLCSHGNSLFLPSAGILFLLSIPFWLGLGFIWKSHKMKGGRVPFGWKLLLGVFIFVYILCIVVGSQFISRRHSCTGGVSF